MNLPRIDRPMVATELRNRILAQLNGESTQLSTVDKERRESVLVALRGARKRKA